MEDKTTPVSQQDATKQPEDSGNGQDKATNVLQNEKRENNTKSSAGDEEKDIAV